MLKPLSANFNTGKRICNWPPFMKVVYDAFRVNRDQLMDLEIWFKIHTIVSNFETAFPKTM